ncbi:MAG: NAD-binding protein, partial [Anaerolineales bacterium]
FGAGSILSARLSLIIAASAIGLRLGIISESVNAAIVLVSLVTVSLAPVLFNRIIPSAKDDSEKLILVAGAGELGIRVAEHLHKHHDHVLLIAKNEEQKERAVQRGMKEIVAQIDIGDPELQPYMENARAVVCTYNSAENSYKVCKMAKQVYGVDHIVARVDDPQEINKFEQLGVVTMNIALDRAALLGLLVRNPGMYNLLTRTDDDSDVGEVVVNKSSHYGKRIREIDLPEELLILALYRDNEYLIPNGDTELVQGDKLSLFGRYACLEKAEEIFG